MAAATKGKDKNQPPPPSPFIEVSVAASNEALEFLHSLKEADFNGLVFDDQLSTIIPRYNNKKVGEYYVTIEHAIKRGDKCFLVKARQTGVTFIEGEQIECTQTVQGHVAYNLETLSQTETYFLKTVPYPYEVKAALEATDEEYVLRKQVTEQGEVKELVQKCTKDKMAGFISDSASFLLHRLFMNKLQCAQMEDAELQELPDELGPLRFIGFDIDHKVSEIRYKYLGTKLQLLGGRDLTVYGFERSIPSTDAKKMPVIIHLFLLKDSHLAMRTQLQSPLLSRVDFAPEFAERDEFLPVPVPEKKRINWEEDGELMMKYADKKESLKADYQMYMREHPEYKAIIGDFLQLLLTHRPERPVDFAKDYFESFSNKVRHRVSKD